MGSFSVIWIVPLGHGESLSLKGVPRPPARHRVVGEVSDSIHGLAAHSSRWFMKERVEKDAFQRAKGLGRQVVIQGQSSVDR